MGRFEGNLDLVIVRIQEVRGQKEVIVVWALAVAVVVADGYREHHSGSTKHCNVISACAAIV